MVTTRTYRRQYVLISKIDGTGTCNHETISSFEQLVSSPKCFLKAPYALKCWSKTQHNSTSLTQQSGIDKTLITKAALALCGEPKKWEKGSNRLANLSVFAKKNVWGIWFLNSQPRTECSAGWWTHIYFYYRANGDPHFTDKSIFIRRKRALVEEPGNNSLSRSFVSDAKFATAIILLRWLISKIERWVSEIIWTFESNILREKDKTKSYFKKRRSSWKPFLRFFAQGQLDKKKKLTKRKSEARRSPIRFWLCIFKSGQSCISFRMHNECFLGLSNMIWKIN